MGKNKYKNGVILGVHSQLNIYFGSIWNCYCQVSQNKDKLSVSNQISRMNEVAVKKLNDAILKSVESKLFLGYETGIENMNGKIEGAYQNEDDLKERSRLGEINMIPLADLIWPFSNQTTYKVNILGINKM